MKTIIIGAGLAGLSAANRLKHGCVVLEKEARPGGFCRTEEKGGFLFDYTGHFLHIRLPDVKRFIFERVKTGLKTVKRRAFIYSNGVYTGYPYQANSYGLPPEVAD